MGSQEAGGLARGGAGSAFNGKAAGPGSQTRFLVLASNAADAPAAGGPRPAPGSAAESGARARGLGEPELSLAPPRAERNPALGRGPSELLRPRPLRACPGGGSAALHTRYKSQHGFVPALFLETICHGKLALMPLRFNS